MENKIKTLTEEEFEKIGYVTDLYPVAEFKIQDLKENSVIIVEANHEKITVGHFAKYLEYVKANAPAGVFVIGVPDSVTMRVLNKEQTIKWLQSSLDQLKEE